MRGRAVHRPALTALIFFVCALAFGEGSIGDSYVATWKGNAKAAYSLTTDDCRPSQVYTIAPALTERGLHGTFYVNPDNRYGWAGFQDIGDVNGDGMPDGYVHLPEQGHELANHTLHHWAVTVGQAPVGFPDSVFPSYTALAAECAYVNRYLEDLTGQRVVSFAYPWGWSDPTARSVLDDYYLSARSLKGYGPDASGHYVPNAATPSNMMLLNCYVAQSTQAWADFLNYDEAMGAFQLMVDDTVAAGGWGIEFSHTTGDDWVNFPSPFTTIDPDAYFDHLDNIVNRANAGDLWQDTVGNVSRYIDSRENAAIEYDETSDTVIRLRVDDMLDDDLFCEPLTVNTLIPESWSNHLRITHNGKPIGYRLYVDPASGAAYASYDVIADGATTVLSRLKPGDYDADGDVDSADFDRWRSDLGMSVATPGYGADGNCDGMVDTADYTVWRDHLPLDPPGDYNHDGYVDKADLERWRRDFGTTVSMPGGGADGNANGIVDAADFTVWRDHISIPPGDYDADGSVDLADLECWRTDFGTTVDPPGSGADGNGDGIVDAADYTVWRDNFVSVSGLGSTAVPEPSASVTLAIGLGLVTLCLTGRVTRNRQQRPCGQNV